MCSLFEMENSGDLTDIVRASGGIYGYGGADSRSNTNPTSNWQFSSQPMNFPSDSRENFGDPFSSARDPLCHAGDISTSSSRFVNTILPGSISEGFFGESLIPRQRIFRDEIRSPQNIFPRGRQISPTTKLPVTSCGPPLLANSQSSIKPASMASGDMISSTSSSRCLIDNSSIQVSSPRRSGTKRRKSQAKKVVCIPALAPANSRSTGEVVPSDLWAWRKYGQKPIKGSPFPRGYYRCSSSKGCSARKQVERSRTDPNMLVITYTSEHNHPWPTVRNALAGSTRSQPSRNSNCGASLKPSNGRQGQKMTRQEEEEEEEEEEEGGEEMKNLCFKEEMEEIDQIKGLEMEGEDQFDEAFAGCTSDDFFAGLDEIQTDDSLNIIFSEALSGNKRRDGKNSDYAFSRFD